MSAPLQHRALVARIVSFVSGVGLALTSAHAQAPSEECSVAVENALQRLQQNPDDAVVVVEDAAILNPACTGAVVRAVLDSGLLDAETARRVVESTLAVLPEQRVAITAAARDQMPEALPERSPEDDEQPLSGSLFEIRDTRVSENAAIRGVWREIAVEDSLVGTWPTTRQRSLGGLGTSRPTTDSFRPGPEVEIGWDSNRGTNEAGASAAYTQIGAGTVAQLADEDTQMEIGVQGRLQQYFDSEPGEENSLIGTRAWGQVEQRSGERWTFRDTFLARYDFEPDLHQRMGLDRRAGQYVVAFNRASAAFDWRENWSLETRHTVQTISYEDESPSAAEDRVTQAIAQSIRHQSSEDQAWELSYEYRSTDFDRAAQDYSAHTVTVGTDRKFSERMEGSLWGGYEMRALDQGRDIGAPVVGLELDFRLTEATRLQLTHRSGLEDSDLFDFESRFTSRSGLIVQHEVSPVLSVHGSLNWLHHEYDGRSGRPSASGDAVNLAIGLSWNLIGDLRINTGYQFTMVETELDLPDYSRHLLSASVSGSF